MPARNKYGARKTGGYDSRREWRRSRQLLIMQRAGMISGLQEQVPYELIPSQKAPDGTTLRAVHYVADFVYHDAEGRLVVEDTKGVRTPAYIIKRKLMLQRYGVLVKEV